MDSTQMHDAKERGVDARATRARIRDAAIECIASDGLDSLTAGPLLMSPASLRGR